MELAEEKEEEARRLRNGYIDQLQMKTSREFYWSFMAIACEG